MAVRRQRRALVGGAQKLICDIEPFCDRNVDGAIVNRHVGAEKRLAALVYELLEK